MIRSRTDQPAAAVARHYDELDAFYREVWGEHLHHGLWEEGGEPVEQAVEQLVERVARRATLRPGVPVCDVGSGYGATARFLACTYDAQVTALTLSPAQHAYACSVVPGATNPSYLCGDWLANEFSPATFEVVLAIESMAHIADKGRALAEAYRVLRPGGRLVLCTWMASEAPTSWQVRHLLEPICREGRLPGLPTAAEYGHLLAGAGFERVAFEDLSRQVRRTWAVCLRRVALGLLSRPRYLAYLLSPGSTNRAFPVTMLRLWVAYRTGAFRYGLFAARRPPTL